ncbi:hypothetical protein NSA50_19580, partial [Clostridium sp. DSM 100503]|uniref:CD3337/EF1877 family mobilome membrane protein n=1 Tax=Clostridium sp. DSM 100503 TaxID=2963282 RepID=UPI00214A34C4
SPFITDSVSGGNTFEYNKYPLENYSLDFYYDAGSAFLPWNWGDNALKVLGTAINMVTNVLLSLTNLLCYFVGFIVEQAFSLDFVTDILNKIKPMIQSVIGFNENGFISNGILSGFIMLLISILGCYLVYAGLLKREVTKAMSSILIFIVVMSGMVGYSLFSDKYLIKLNDFSKQVSSSMLNIGNNIGNSGDEIVSNETVVAGIRDRLFQLQIQKPYLLLQYGTSSIKEINENDSNRVSSILNHDSDSKEREEAVKKEVQNGNKNMGISGLGVRLGNVILMLILNVIFSIVILMFAGAMLYYQLLFLFYAIVLPINFIVGLVPSFSNNGVKGITNLLGSVLKRQGLCLIVSLVFTVSNFIYDVTDEGKYGFLFVFCIQLLLFGVACMKSHEVLSLFDFDKGNKSMISKFFNTFNHRMRRLNKDKYKMNPFFDRRNNNKNNNDNSNSNSNENNNRYTSKYKNKDNDSNKLANRNMSKNEEGNNKRELASRNGDKEANNKKGKEGLKNLSEKNKIKRLPDDTKYKVRNTKEPLSNVKEKQGNKVNGIKDNSSIKNKAEKRTYRRRVNEDNKNRNENINKENESKFKSRENQDKKYNEVGRNVVSTNRRKELRKRGKINAKRK